VTDSEKFIDKLWYRINYDTGKDAIYIYIMLEVMLEDVATPPRE